MSSSWKHFSALLQRLSRRSSPINISGNSVNVLYSPEQFFTTLKVLVAAVYTVRMYYNSSIQDGVAKARKRIIFSSLYLGTQKREQELVSQ